MNVFFELDEVSKNMLWVISRPFILGAFTCRE
jgi:hypothetical protein